MRKVLHKGEFCAVCPRCGAGAHCHASGGDQSRCPHRKEWGVKTDRQVEFPVVKGNRRDPAL